MDFTESDRLHDSTPQTLATRGRAKSLTETNEVWVVSFNPDLTECENPAVIPIENADFVGERQYI